MVAQDVLVSRENCAQVRAACFSCSQRAEARPSIASVQSRAFFPSRGVLSALSRPPRYETARRSTINQPYREFSGPFGAHSATAITRVVAVDRNGSISSRMPRDTVVPRSQSDSDVGPRDGTVPEPSYRRGDLRSKRCVGQSSYRRGTMAHPRRARCARTMRFRCAFRARQPTSRAVRPVSSATIPFRLEPIERACRG